jgi:hypothetical protein
MGETIAHEKSYAAPYRGSTTQKLQGRDDDRDRPWACLEPLLHAQRRWRSSGPGPVSYQSIGSREVVYRSASGADRDGSGNALDLDQRTASGTGSRSDRCERARATCDLAQRSEERCFAKRSLAVLPRGLVEALGPVLQQIAEMTVKIKHYDRAIKRLTETEYPETQALIKVYGVGQLTALTYVLTLGSKERCGACSVDQNLAEIDVAALADAQQLGLCLRSNTVVAPSLATLQSLGPCGKPRRCQWPRRSRLQPAVRCQGSAAVFDTQHRSKRSVPLRRSSA